MGTLIHAVGHGLVADDTIMIGNLVGGTGLSENTVYYVLAAGLTADDFAVSDSSGGTAITYTTDITDGVIVRTDTYTAIADGIQDPPTALTVVVPDPPTLTSTEVSGIVRLYIEVPGYTDPANRVRLTEVAVTHRYESGVPVWESATVLSLPKGTSNMSIPALGSTLYAARSRVQDVYGNYSDWCYDTVTLKSYVELTTNAGVDSKVPADLSITEGKIATDAIVARHILAGEISADKLATTLLLASLIQTAQTGRRIEIDVDGIRLYDTDESLMVRIPTNGDAVYVRGEVTASDLTSTVRTTLTGTASLSGNSIMTLMNGISAPTSAPTLTGSVDYTTITAPTGAVSSAAGIAYDSAAGTFWLACDPTISPYYVAQEFNATTGALVRSIAATGSTTTYTTTLGSTSHVSDTAQAYSGSTNSHIATPLTMPRAGRITKVSVYLAGYGGSATCYNVLWTDVSGTGNYVARSASYTAASAAFANGNSVKYDKALTASYSIASGATIYAGVYHSSSGDGIQYDRDDGSSKYTYGGDGSGTATADFDGTGWGSLTSSSKPNVYITYEYDVDTRLETAPNIGIATDGTYIYTLDNTGVIWKYLRSDMSYVSKSASLAASIPGTEAKAGLFFYNAGTPLLVITTTASTGAGVQPYFVQVDPATLTVSSTYATTGGPTFSGTTDTFRGGVYLVDPLNSSTFTFWIATTSGVYAYNYTGGATFANTSNRDFGTAATSGDGLTHDGTVFRGWDSASTTKVWKFSTWDWTTGGNVWWFGYAWYANTGGYVTQVGPTASITATRRTRVQVQNATLPGGAADRVRVYSYQGASDAAAGSRWLQVTDALTSRYVTAYANATNDSATNTFSSGTPAELKSEATGWSLKGDGTIRVSGAGSGAPGLKIGDDSTILDVDIADTMGVQGQQNAANGGIAFGSGKDTNLYRAAANSLVTDDDFGVAGVQGSHGSGTALTISGGGSATFTNKFYEWVKIGKLVVVQFGFSASGGTGATAISISSPGWPAPDHTAFINGDKGGSGVYFVGARVDTAGAVSTIRRVDSGAGVTGADLSASTSLYFTGAWLTT